MKLSSLFAKYLYLKKELSLPGIGTFSLDPAVVVPEAADKNVQDFMQQIRFTQKTILAADEDFISFIRTETGKIKPLAESDLDSFLTDGKILLNIGKPFQIEGIGSILKTRAGVFEFTPGDPIHNKEGFYKEVSEDTGRKKSAYSDEQTKSSAMRILLIAAGIIGGLTLVIWGGYTLYNMNAGGTTVKQPVADSIVITPTKANTILDSVKNIINAASSRTASAGSYKFIIERTSNKARAIRRFNQIKDTKTGIRMETPDSTIFTLYFDLPAQPADTSRIRDSLKNWYGRRNVYIER